MCPRRPLAAVAALALLAGVAGAGAGTGQAAVKPVTSAKLAKQLKVLPKQAKQLQTQVRAFAVQLSALSALFLMQTIARKGERVPLTLLADRDPIGLDDDAPRQAMRVSTANTLVRMLEVTTRTGTSAKVFHDEDGHRVFPHMNVAGKTGTLIGGHPSRMFSWFAGFAPSRHPEVAISVMLANDVKWWTKGNAVAREMLEAYFEHTKKKKVTP